MKIGSGKPVVGATLVVARSRHQPVFISLCGLHNAMVIAMKTGSGKPAVGATLVVARSRRQPLFIPLMWPDKAIVIPNAAKRSEESRISRYRSRAIRHTFYFLPPPAISAPSAVSPDAPGIDKKERPYYTFLMRSPISQLYDNAGNTTKCNKMQHFLKECPR